MSEKSPTGNADDTFRLEVEILIYIFLCFVNIFIRTCQNLSELVLQERPTGLKI
jgi:hypothetical protein